MKISGAFGSGTIESLTARDVATGPDASRDELADSLSLSDAARALEAAASHSRFGGLSVTAHRDPVLARELAYNYAHAIHQPIIDLTDEIAGTGPAKYAATGEPVTPEREAFYRRLAQDLQTKSLALYNQEMARGTDEATIFDELIALGDKAPVELRDIIDWNLRLG